MRGKITVLSVSPYRVEDRETRQINEGVTLWYYPVEHLNPVKRPAGSFTELGAKPVKTSVLLEDLHLFPEVPGVYDCDFLIRSNSAGKGITTLYDFKFIGAAVVSGQTPAADASNKK